MKKRAMVATVGLAAFGVGAYACWPSAQQVWPVAYNAVSSLSLPSDQAVLGADRAILEGAWGRMRRDVVVGGATPLYGGGAVFGGLVVLVLALGGRRGAADERVEMREVELPEGAHWATTRELTTYRRPGSTLPIRLGRACTVTATGRVRASGPQLGIPRRLARENVLVVAPPGGGKSLDIIAALLDMSKARKDAPSLFAWDPKGEVAKKCAAQLRRIGYEVLEMHPFMERGRINPMRWLTSARWIETFLSAWLANTESGVGGTSDEVHEGWTRQIVGAAILALRGQQGDEATLPMVFRALDGEPEEVYALLKEADDEGGGAATWYRLMTGPQGTFDRQRASIKTRGAAFKEPSMRHFVEGHDLDLDRLLTRTGKPLAVFYQLPTATQEMVLPLTAGIVALLFAKVGDYAAGGEIERDLLCIFDEAGSGAVIPSLPQGLNTLRGAGVAQVIVVQYLGQLIEKYTKYGAAGIRAACGTWIGMGGMLPEDAALFAERLGERSIRVDRTTVGKDAATGKRRRREAAPDTVARPLMTELQIRHLPRYVRLVSPRDSAPTLTYSRPYFQERRLERRVRASAFVPAAALAVTETVSIAVTSMDSQDSQDSQNAVGTSAPESIGADARAMKEESRQRQEPARQGEWWEGAGMGATTAWAKAQGGVAWVTGEGVKGTKGDRE